jgi:hypothetical protein
MLSLRTHSTTLPVSSAIWRRKLCLQQYLPRWHFLITCFDGTPCSALRQLMSGGSIKNTRCYLGHDLHSMKCEPWTWAVWCPNPRRGIWMCNLLPTFTTASPGVSFHRWARLGTPSAVTLCIVLWTAVAKYWKLRAIIGLLQKSNSSTNKCRNLRNMEWQRK